jgi:hypothetical protein
MLDRLWPVDEKVGNAQFGDDIEGLRNPVAGHRVVDLLAA